MIVNSTNLRTLGVSFSALFKDALKNSASTYATIATPVPANTIEQEYGWMAALPRVREWLGDRQVNNLGTYSYKIKERSWESTVAVKRRAIETDNIGIYNPIMTELGKSAGTAYDELCWPMLNDGFTSLCYDGQYFFDTDHPVLDENGAEQSVANTDGGNGTPWFLVATDATIKPIVLQKGKEFEFVSKTNPDDENVFQRDEFLYGTSAYHNAGYGLWQTCWGSKQPLDAAHYNTAMEALMGMKGDHGRPFNFKNFKLIVPPSKRADGLQIVNAERNADGSSNVNFKTAELQVESWLA